MSRVTCSPCRGIYPMLALALVAASGAHIMGTAGEVGPSPVAGLKVGHHTLDTRPTGCTVILAEGGAVAGVDVRGSAPGTRETDLLNPLNLVDQVHAIVLSGGSAFGLDAASGVMRYLEERRIGFPTAYGVVPIVPAAILFDLGVGNPKIRPDAGCGYAAAAAASAGPIPEGNVGAGAGATVGKMLGMDRAMKGGIGAASITLPDGVVVTALVAVNAYGDVIEPATGRVIAGVRTADGNGLADARVLLRSGAALQEGRRPELHDRRRGDQRDADQDAGRKGGADGPRRPRAVDHPRAQPLGRRHAVRARHGEAGRRSRCQPDWRHRRRGRGRCRAARGPRRAGPSRTAGGPRPPGAAALT